MLILVNPRKCRVKVNSDLLRKFLFPPSSCALTTSGMAEQAGEYWNNPRFLNLHYRNWILNDGDNKAEHFINNSWSFSRRNYIQIIANNIVKIESVTIWFDLTSWQTCLPLKVPMMRLLMMCHNCGSPDFLAIIRYCLHGDTSKCVIGPPGTVMHRICDGRGTGSQPVSGTNCKNSS